MQNSLNGSAITLNRESIIGNDFIYGDGRLYNDNELIK